MKLPIKTKEEKIKDKVTLYRNALKAGLSHVGDDIFEDGTVYPTQYYRFGFARSVKSIKEAIKERNEGNIQAYSVTLDNFESLIPNEALSVLVNRRAEAILQRRVKEEIEKIGLSTEIPENIFDPERDTPFDPDNFSYFDEGYSFDLAKWS
jgi:hypothetical protein